MKEDNVMKVYRVYTDLGDGCNYMTRLYIKEETALKDMYARRENGDESYTDELDVITQ